MKPKKILVGVVATAMVLSTGAAAYAAQPDSSNLFATQGQNELYTAGEGMPSLDETALPEGVWFAREISQDGEGDNLVQSVSLDDGDGALAIDETALPEGVQFARKISQAGEGDNLVQTASIDAVEGTLSFDEGDLPEGVWFALEVSQGGVANGVMNWE